jgi:hypothetical protein
MSNVLMSCVYIPHSLASEEEVEGPHVQLLALVLRVLHSNSPGTHRSALWTPVDLSAHISGWPLHKSIRDI